MLARRWLGDCDLIWSREAQIARAERSLTHTERIELARPLMAVVRSLMDREEPAEAKPRSGQLTEGRNNGTEDHKGE